MTPYWITVENPSQELLDRLLKEASTSEPCPDCGTKIGKKHKGGCDVARCLKCGTQALTCGCKTGPVDTWDGMWPGKRECYEKKYVTTGPIKNSKERFYCFDLNRLAAEKTNRK